MTDLRFFYVRLLASAALLTVWAYCQIFAISILGQTLLPLILSSIVAPAQVRPYKPTPRFWIITWTVTVAIIASVFLLPDFWQAFSLSSPWFVVPIWLFGMAGLAKRARDMRSEAANKSFKPNSLRESA